VKQTRNEALCSPQLLDPARFEQGNGINEAGFGEALDPKTVGNNDDRAACR
jgi:hypothetical protein